MKKKRNRFWIAYIILIILTLPLAISCPATPETLNSSEDKPYIAPAAPQNLNIQNGLQNRIVLSWDPVVDADLYIIEYSSADQPSEYKRIGETKNTSYEIIANSGNGSVRLDPNQSYFFSVKAITFFGTSSKESEMSDIIEGAMAPEELEVLIFPTNFDITVSWSSPNLLGYDGLPLYDATFELRYKKSDESDWKTISDPKTADVWEEYSFGINEFNLVYNAYYDFEIVMTISSESGPVSISSGVKTAKVSEDYSPSNIKDYVVSTDYPDKIVVSWIFPSWAKEELKDTSCFFIIERCLEGSDDWEVLVDEISAKGVRDPNIHFDGAGDEPNTLKFSYNDFASDSEIIAGKNYIYRITNAVKQTEDIFYRANPDGLVSSPAGSLYYPIVSNLQAEYKYDGDNTAKANVMLSFAMDDELPEGFKWAIRKTIYHPDQKEESILLELDCIDNRFEFEEKLDSNDTCTTRKHEYSYSLVLTYNGNEYGEDLGLFGSDRLVLENKELFDGPVSSLNNRVGRVAISWTEVAGVSLLSPLYSYSFGGGKFVSIDSSDIVRDGNSCSYVFETELDSVSELILRAETSDGQYVSVSTIEAGPLVFPEDFEINSVSGYVSKVELSWISDGLINQDVRYVFEYKNGSGDWIAIDSVDINASSFTFNSEDVDASEFNFRFAVYNTKHEDEGRVISKEAVGYLLHAPENIIATKAEYTDKIVVSWDKVEAASSYNLYAYSDSGLENEILSVNTSDLTYEFISEDSNVSDVYFTVGSIGLDNEPVVQTEFGTSEDAFGNSIADNLGYTFSFNVSSEKDSSGILSPYTRLTWRHVPLATKYVITHMNEANSIDEEITINAKATNYSNGVISYCDNSGEIKAVLDVGGYTITAYEDGREIVSVSDDSVVYRQLNEKEYVNLLNTILRDNLVESGIKDWFPPEGAGEGGRTDDFGDENNGFYVRTPGGKFWSSQNRSDPGWIQFRNNYSHDGIELIYLNTHSGNDNPAGNDIRIWAGDNGGEGYLGIDPLQYIGSMNNAKYPSTVYITAAPDSGFLPANIVIDNIDIINNTGSYNVSINGAENKQVQYSDCSVKISLPTE